MYAVTNDVVGRTRDFSVTSPAWVDVTPSGATTHVDFIIDPWNVTTGLYHLSDAGLYKCTDADQTTPSWSLVLSKAAAITGTGALISLTFAHVSCSINVEDYVGILAYVENAGTTPPNEHWYIYSTNGGASWNYSLITGSASGTKSNFDIVPHLIGGELYIYAYLDRSNDGYLYRSTDSGATWSLRLTTSLASSDPANLVHCPYNGNTSGNIVYFGHGSNASLGGVFFVSTDGGVTKSTIAGGGVGGVTYGPQLHRIALETFTQNNQRIFLWEEVSNQLYTSVDGGANWSAAAQVGLSGTPTAAGGFPYNGLQYYVVTTSDIFVSTDGGATFTDKTGDWAFGFSSGLGSYYDVIVPVWVAE